MSRVLLPDTNVSSAPIHDYLVRAGHEVFVCGANPNDFLARCSANYIELDYSDVGRTRKLFETLNIDCLVPGCNDRSYQVCAELNAEGRYAGLDDREAAATINNKQKFREFASRAGLPVPRLVPPGEIGTTWPLIVKPVDAYSGRGVAVVREAERDALPEIVRRAESYSRTRSCLIEEFVEGQLYSHSAFVSNGEIAVDFIVEEHGTANPFVVDTSRVVHDFPAALLSRVRDSIVAMARQLHLADGLIHTQFIRKADAFWLIEITRRCPGDLYSQLIESATGYRYVEAYVRPFLGQPGVPPLQPAAPSRVMRHTISLATEGVLGSLRFSMPIRIERLVPLSLAGDRIRASPFSRIALLFASASCETEFSALYEATLARRLYAVDAGY